MGKINVAAWMKEFRVRFLIFVTLPVVLGAAIAREYFPEQFSVPYFLLSAFAMMLLHAGTIVANDYFDFISGTDLVNRSRTPFSGGSGMLPDRLLKPGQVLAASILCFVICALVGIFIVVTRSPEVLLVGAAGMALGIAYTVPPFKLAYRGLGELARLVATPLIVLGAFLVQVPAFTGPGLAETGHALIVCLAASIPVAFLNTAALYIFEFPDYEADAHTGKRNLVVRLGRARATWLFLAMEALAFLSLAVTVAIGTVPLAGMAMLLLLPVSVYAVAGLQKNNSDAQVLIPHMRAASGTYIVATAIMVLAFLL